ncbi:efflux RND transporter permease subunit, partial [Bordetella hinzii]|nr:efflux RND transporter permease subunit [Bordetella hinzii]
SGSQHAIGTGVIGGMLSGTFLAIFFVPLFFVLVLRLFKVRRLTEIRAQEEAAHAHSNGDQQQ